MLFSIVCRLPQIVLWIWLNLLVLCLANQRLPDSITEDAANKPWRPLPSRRMTAVQARRVLIGAILVTYSASWLHLGGVHETLALFILNWIYNDLEAANEHWAVRNLLNALGITCIGAGAARVGCAPGYDLSTDSWQWWLVVSLVLLTTIQAQDLYDQEGDAKRGRSTIPLILGDAVARWTVAVSVMCWTVAVPAFWGIGGAATGAGAYFLVPMSLGLLVAGRVLDFFGMCMPIAVRSRRGLYGSSASTLYLSSRRLDSQLPQPLFSSFFLSVDKEFLAALFSPCTTTMYVCMYVHPNLGSTITVDRRNSPVCKYLLHGNPFIHTERHLSLLEFCIDICHFLVMAVMHTYVQRVDLYSTVCVRAISLPLREVL